MSIIAIDPGTTNTGLVHMDENRIIAAKTIHFDKAVRVNQGELFERAAEISRFVRAWAAGRDYEAIVIEGFISFPGKTNAFVFQTPYLCGFLHGVLRTQNLVIQTSKEVLNPKSRGNVAHIKDAMAHGEDIWPGCEVCTNDHLRSAACHGIYYYARKHDA